MHEKIFTYTVVLIKIQDLCQWLPILPSEELILCNCSRERIGGKLEKKVAASVFGSRVAADDPASCQVSYDTVSG